MTHLNSAVDEHERPIRGIEPNPSGWVIAYVSGALVLVSIGALLAVWVLA